jgi:protein-S-isoprenylcysteine O-methyltransferase Ste14
VLLFLLAGTLAWPAAWIFLAEMFGLSLLSGLRLARRDPALLRERLGSPYQKDQGADDKRLMTAILLVFVLWFAFMPLDAVRFGWSSVPHWAQAVGALGIALSIWIGDRTMRANSFAAPVVKIQVARGHRVADSGPYRYVRHPMYAGALFFFLGVPLLLGSWWGLVFAPLLAGLLCRRILIEEKALRAGLAGYDDYAARIRYRLIPGIW